MHLLRLLIACLGHELQFRNSIKKNNRWESENPGEIIRGHGDCGSLCVPALVKMGPVTWGAGKSISGILLTMSTCPRTWEVFEELREGFPVVEKDSTVSPSTTASEELQGVSRRGGSCPYCRSVGSCVTSIPGSGLAVSLVLHPLPPVMRGLLPPAPDKSPTFSNVSSSLWSFSECSLLYPLWTSTCPWVLSEAFGPNPRRQTLVTSHRPSSQKWPSCLPNDLPIQLDNKLLQAGVGTLPGQGF